MAQDEFDNASIYLPYVLASPLALAFCVNEIRFHSANSRIGANAGSLNPSPPNPSGDSPGISRPTVPFGAELHARVLLALLCLSSLALPLESSITYVGQLDQDQAQSELGSAVLNDYAESHPDELLFFGKGTVSRNPLSAMPANLLVRGGWAYYLPQAKQRAAELGFPDGLDFQTLMQPNVRFAASAQWNPQILAACAQNNLGVEVGYEYEELDNDALRIYRFYAKE